MRPVVGLDISGDRVAWAIVDGGLRSIGVLTRKSHEHSHFALESVNRLQDETRTIWATEIYALEINLYPRITFHGRPTANLIRNYMVCRWTEGRVLQLLNAPNPATLERVRGGGWKLNGKWNVVTSVALQASGGKGAKDKRRAKMRLVYGNLGVGEDEIDALSIADEVYRAGKGVV